MYSTIKSLLATGFVALLYGCSGSNLIANGGATETVNATVVVKDSSICVLLKSNDILYTDIKIIETDYNPVTGEGFIDSIFLTGSNASVSFTQKSGTYNILLHEKNSNKLLLIPSVQSGYAHLDTICDTLSIGSVLKGNVTLTQGFDTTTERCSIYLSGTTFFQNITADRTFSFNNIPGGAYTVTAAITSTEKLNTSYLERSVSQEVTLARDSAVTDVNLYFSN